ncbi:hypothetical protein GCM10011581_22290 [Saccharopolyspora subtropica]|uniref:Uncharacterized protein n=1 Tax=Saccharopolyspora thermophila TaxID=89367 RepID=A0A917JTY9_9PSEU|nr:hypothetical protein [Saccharopolyspora subtropica]GGI84714.1 hypothetical protein GCM10011581_22290 [Saccharopolyspora subtropica]
MDDQIRQRLAELRSLADELHPEQIEVEIGRARVEAYQAGMRYAANFIEHGPHRGAAGGIPLPREL